MNTRETLTIIQIQAYLDELRDKGIVVGYFHG